MQWFIGAIYTNVRIRNKEKMMTFQATSISVMLLYFFSPLPAPQKVPGQFPAGYANQNNYGLITRSDP